MIKLRRKPKYTESTMMRLQESGHNVIDSELLSGVHYIIKDNAVGVTTLNNGMITMSIDAFRTMAKEALEVFDFWEG